MPVYIVLKLPFLQEKFREAVSRGFWGNQAMLDDGSKMASIFQS